MTMRKTIMGYVGGAILALSTSSMAYAAEYSFNLQSFLPAQATIPSKIIDVWADNVEEASGAELKSFAMLQCNWVANHPSLSIRSSMASSISHGTLWATRLAASLQPKHSSCHSS